MCPYLVSGYPYGVTNPGNHTKEGGLGVTNIADEIRAEMARQKLTAVSLAARAGVKRGTLARKLRGERDFTFREVEGVAQALGMPMWRLVAGAETRPRANGYTIQGATRGDLGSAA